MPSIIAVCKVNPKLMNHVSLFSRAFFLLQGDFPHGLVKNLPKTLWTRQLKVSELIATGTHWRTATPSSSQAYQTLPYFTNVAFGYVQAAASVLPCPPPFSFLIGGLTPVHAQLISY